MAYGYEEFKKDVYKLTNINLSLYKERQMKRRIESLIARKGFDGFESFFQGMKQD
ncbi:MAG: chemotaxis protein CheR, partial [Lachnospiraceae bacterium]|nr:chemotaxis protein CheR [Lachnospiraceae bacterium]